MRLLDILKFIPSPTEGSHDRCSTSHFNKANVPVFTNFPVYPLGYPTSKRKAEKWYQNGKERKATFQHLALSRRTIESKAKEASSTPSGFNFTLGCTLLKQSALSSASYLRAHTNKNSPSCPFKDTKSTWINIKRFYSHAEQDTKLQNMGKRQTFRSHLSFYSTLSRF